MKQEDYQGAKQKVTSQTGFTLVELLVTMTLAALIMAFGIPSFNLAIRNNRLTSYANDFLTSANLARSEAIKRGKSVTVRKVDANSFSKTGTDWEDGWDIFVDLDADGNYDAGELLIKTNQGFRQGYTMRGNGTLANYLRYGPFGQTSAGSMVICDNRDGDNIPEADASRLIAFIATGRSRINLDSDLPKDGIPNKSGGGANIISCSPPF